MIVYFKDVFFLSSNLYNLISLVLLNTYTIFSDNKNKRLYNLKIKKIRAQVKYWNNSFLFQLFNLLNIAVNIIKTLDKA